MTDTQNKNNELPLDGIKEYKREIKEFSGRNVVFFYLEGKEHVLEKEHKIRRFVKKGYFVNGYKESKYYFSNPESWNDPCEKKFLAENLNKGLKLPCIRALCSSNSTVDSEEALWFVDRGQKDEPMVCTYINLHSFLEELCRNLPENVGVFVSQINYRRNLKNLSAEKVREYLSSLKTENVTEEYIKILSLKRTAFAYEDEIRIFLVCAEAFESDVKDSFAVKNMNYNNFVKEVLLPPFSPEEVEIIKKCILNKRCKEEREELENLLGESFKADIKKSRLYEP